MDLVGLIKMWLIETCEVWMGKRLFIIFRTCEIKRYFISIYFHRSFNVRNRDNIHKSDAKCRHIKATVYVFSIDPP